MIELLRKFFPYEYVKDVFSIDYEKLAESGYKAIIFDIDNTLVHHGDDSNELVDELFRQIHSKGLKTLLLSNNSAERIERFIKNIDTLYIEEAEKPDKAGYTKALEMLDVKKEEAIVIGDQIFTDIYGANKCGIPCVLVEFIRKDKNAKIGKKRMLEKVILYFYGKSKLKHRIREIIKKESGNENVSDKGKIVL